MEDSPRVPLSMERGEHSTLISPGESFGIAGIERQSEEYLSHLQEGESDRADITERLLFSIDGAPYSVLLAALREAILVIPSVVSLPFSPPWLLGLFSLRTEMITLIDPRPVLTYGPEPEAASGQFGSVSGEKALLMGEPGRFIAFVVDQIGDIANDARYGAQRLARESERLPTMARYMDDTRPVEKDVSAESVAALDLATFYSDVISSLEAWARHV